MLYRESTARLWMVLVSSALLGLVSVMGCDDGDESAEEEDTQETDTGETDGEETDTGDSTNGTCISNIVGEIKTDKGESWEGRLSICIPMCVPLTTDDKGQFEQPVGRSETPGGPVTKCKKFDFEGTMAPLHLTIYDSTGTYAAYGAAYTPTQAEVSDQGAEDYEYDLGTLVLHELPAEKVDYSAELGASVDLSGVSFELPAKSLVRWEFEGEDFLDIPEDTAEIRVFEAPLDTWRPPFDDVGLDAIYFIAPRWAKLAGEGVPLSITPPAGWSDGDKGTLYILADDVSGLGTMNEYIVQQESGTCATSIDILDKEPGGELAECGTVEMVEGRIITPAIPRLSWLGFGK